MKETLDNFENAVDEVVAPARLMRWTVRIVLLVVLIAVGATVGKIALHMTHKVDQVTTNNRDWFVEKHAAIEASEFEEVAARQALNRHIEDVRERTSSIFSIGRKADRDETIRLNHSILEIQTKRVALIQEYNTRAAQVTDPDVLVNLPREIMLGHAQPERAPINQVTNTTE